LRLRLRLDGCERGIFILGLGLGVIDGADGTTFNGKAEIVELFGVAWRRHGGFGMCVVSSRRIGLVSCTLSHRGRGKCLKSVRRCPVQM
jgi:hypothetical protein